MHEQPGRWLPLVGTLLTLAFGIWAGVVAWGVRTVINEVTDIHAESVAFHREFSAYVLQSERRMTVLEATQSAQDKQLAQIQAEQEQLSRPRRP